MADAPPVESPGVVWWLEEAESAEPATPHAPLTRHVTADVCVVGGGFTGLWSAIEVAECDPGARVVLLEAQACGHGASGRNGGWATGWHDELDSLVAHFGEAEALRLAQRSAWAIDRIESFCAQHGVDCHFRRRGALWTASTPWQIGAWDGPLAACERLGRAAYLERLAPDEATARTGSPVLAAGARQTDAASLQPALLVRGLRRVAAELGVTIHESTPMRDLARGEVTTVRTPSGSVAARTVVLATGAWTARLRELRRAIVPIGSHLLATEPLGDRLEGLEWAGGELLGDSRLMVHYAQVTRGGRVVFGRGGGALGPAGTVPFRLFHDPAALADIARDFRRWFPHWSDVRLTHGWGGPVDRAPGHLPFVGRLAGAGTVLYGLGYSGNGVAPSALIGRILGRLALGMSDEDTTGALARGVPAYLPPEPLRSVGGALVRAAVHRAEDEHGRGTQSPLAHRALRRLIATRVPAWLEPRRRARRPAVTRPR
ncbi:MAG: FAD-dependent oxidoreductase [Acidobacteriota bacterium]|nr:FAD-dependent oxidoreductase [Acidobacteriota bacterium]